MGKGRICIVTNELHGLFKNGGIGTANTGLALTLAEAGFSVTVAFASWSGLPGHEFRQVRDDYRKVGVELELITETPLLPKPFASPQSASYAVYLYLLEREFDAVYFHDNCGRGYYALLAKHTGIFPNPPRMFVVCHGPHEWVYEINALRYYDKEPIVYAFLERRSVELADAVISPSQYLVDWMLGHGWKLPTSVFVEQNIVQAAKSGPPNAQDRASSVKELVFFGRTEARKGVTLFCDTIDLLESEIDLSEIRVTFLGKFTTIEDVNSGVYLFERSRRWSCPVRFLAKLDQKQALDYLTRADTLAVIPSLAENSPCVVAECLQLGIPFVATDSGGTAELIAPEDREACLTAANPKALAAKLTAALQLGQLPARMAVPQSDTIARWVGFLRAEAIEPPEPAEEPTTPLVSVCLVRTAHTKQLDLESIRTQTYANFEIIIADTVGAMLHTAAVAPEGEIQAAQVIDCTGLRPAGARNLAASKANGAYLLFLDETASLMPDCIAVLVQAARRTSLAMVTSFSLPAEGGAASARVSGNGTGCFPLGPCLEIGAVENCYGESIALVERDAFAAIGGFAPVNDDIPGFWQFFAAAVVAGQSLEVVPRALFQTIERPPLSAADFLKSSRATLELYKQKPVSLLEKLLEKFIDADAEQANRLDNLIGGFDQGVRNLARQISRFEPNSPEALEGFLRYCIDRGNVQEALEFAFYNGVAGGTLVRWVKKETVIQFDWAASRRWEIELHLGSLINADQLRRIGAYLGDRELSVNATVTGGNKTRLRIKGFPGTGAPAPVTVRVQLPSVHRSSDPATDFGFAIDRMAIQSADEEPDDASGDIQAEMTGVPVAAESQHVDPAPARALDIAAGRQDMCATAGSVRLDDYLADGGYRHIDLSIGSMAAGGEDWSSVKFKFCRSGAEHHLELREAPGWPSMFIEFPGIDQDEYGFVMRLSRKGVTKIAKWTFDRDKILLLAILTLLPAAIASALDQSTLQPDERAVWMKEARQFSEGFLRDLRQSSAIEGGVIEMVTAAETDSVK